MSLLEQRLGHGLEREIDLSDSEILCYQFDICIVHLGKTYTSSHKIYPDKSTGMFYETFQAFYNALVNMVRKPKPSGGYFLEFKNVLAGEEISYSIKFRKFSKLYEGQLVYSCKITKKLGEESD